MSKIRVDQLETLDSLTEVSVSALGQVSEKVNDPETGLARRVIYVDTLADLQALPTSGLVDGQRINIADWWDGGLFALTQPYKGGGTLVVTTDTENALHNGGTIIDPSVPHPDSQSGSTHSERLENYLNGVGATGSDIRYIRLPDGSIGLRPEWFGAKADCIIDNNTLVQGTDDFAAFRKIIDLIEDSQGDNGYGNGLSCIQLSEAGYMIGQTLRTIGNLRILGSANAKHISRGPQAFLTGMPEMNDGIFLLTGFGQRTAGNGAGISYGFELDHVGFRGYSHTGGNRLPCAVKSIAVGAPARPMNVLSCQIRNFDKALNFDLSENHGTSTGIYNLNITGSVFSYNSFALYGTGKNAIGGLVFKGNVSEQGGRICIERASGFGTFDISDNLLEGQSDTIKIGLGYGIIRLGPNYWESNTGIDVDVDATAQRNSSFHLSNQYSISGNLQIFHGRMRSDAHRAAGRRQRVVVNTRGGLGHIDSYSATGGIKVFEPENIPVNSERIFRGTVGPGIYELSRRSPLIDENNSSLKNPESPTGATHTLISPVGEYRFKDLRVERVDYGSVGAALSPGDVAVLCAWVFSEGVEDALSHTLLGSNVSAISGEANTIDLVPGWNAVMIAIMVGGSHSDHSWRLSGGGDSYAGPAFCYVLPATEPLPWAFPKTITKEIL